MQMAIWLRIAMLSQGMLLFISGPILWSAKQQEITSLSTTESDYVTAIYVAKEVLWLHFFLFQFFDTNLKLTTLFSDN